MVCRGYGLRQKYSLCWFQRASSKSFQSNGYGRSPVTASSTTTACEIQLSRVTAEFQLLRVRYVKLRLSQVTGAHRMLSTCVEIRNRACGFAGYKCSKSVICTQRYLLRFSINLPTLNGLHHFVLHIPIQASFRLIALHGTMNPFQKLFPLIP